MKHFIGAGTLAAFALFVRLGAFQGVGLDIHIHDTYRVISSSSSCLLGLEALTSQRLAKCYLDCRISRWLVGWMGRAFLG